MDTGEEIEILAKLNRAPRQVVVSRSDRVFINFASDSFTPSEIVELANGTLKPFPRNGEPTLSGDKKTSPLQGIVTIAIDGHDRLWLMDTPNSPISPNLPIVRLSSWEMNASSPVFEMYLPPEVFTEIANTREIVIDSAHEFAYLSEGVMRGRGLLVVNLRDKTFRHALANHPLVHGAGIGALTLEQTATFLYYASGGGTRLYRVRTADLRHPPAGGDERIVVEDMGEIPPAAALAIDSASRIYVAEANSSVIGVLRPDEGYSRLYDEDELLSGAVSLAHAEGPDRTSLLYVASHGRQKLRHVSGEQKPADLPSYVLRLKPPCGCEAKPGSSPFTLR
jgi:hypothetical protein